MHLVTRLNIALVIIFLVFINLNANPIHTTETRRCPNMHQTYTIKKTRYGLPLAFVETDRGNGATCIGDAGNTTTSSSFFMQSVLIDLIPAGLFFMLAKVLFEDQRTSKPSV